MDILVVRPDGSWYSRPDITLVRDRDRFYLPDDCTGALACRCRVVRAEKAGKAIASRFFSRYFSQWAEGVTFYGVLADGRTTPYLDRATWVSRDFAPLDSLPEGFTSYACETIVRITTHLPVRIGDLVCFETENPLPLRRNESIDGLTVL